ncbi:MAG TPA: GTP-binding protein, partial [Acidimicrobiales bacterium]|nr:GTP-binding protein [Acidimicrobiales bacterium]
GGGVAAPGSSLLRFAAIGSVDDGKSTLIGRLLHDTKQLFDDQLEALSTASRRRGVEGMDLSFVTDGLRAEREQGITIDVAYRYAATPRRKFVIADCPGHIQYTRNMATGASTADLGVVVVDATTGLRQQTRRHCCITALLGVRHLLVAANKMDLAGWDESTYRSVGDEMASLARRLGIETVITVPVSALHGDNVVEPSRNSPWYNGPTILEALEEAPANAWATDGRLAARLPVQWVVRHPGGGRSYAGMVSGGTLRSGDDVVVLPGGGRSHIESVGTFDGVLEQAISSLSVTVSLADDLDVGRGDLIAPVDGAPEVLREFEATVCWFGEQNVEVGQRFRLKHTTRITPARLASLEGRLDVDSLSLVAAGSLSQNDIGVGRITVATPIAADLYRVNRVTGSFVIIDEATNATVAAGMVGAPAVVGADAGATG